MENEPEQLVLPLPRQHSRNEFAASFARLYFDTDAVPWANALALRWWPAGITNVAFE